MAVKKPLDAYHEKLLDEIIDAFGDSLDTVQAYIDDEDHPESQESGYTINTPAALVDLEMMDVLVDQGDGKDGIQCNVSIHCVLGSATANLQQELRNFAAEMMRQVKNKPFGGVCEQLAARPEQITAMPGGFKKGKAGYDSWVVSFHQVVFLGEVIWDGEEIDPQKVFFGHAPNIGLDHIDDYEQVVG